jgi:hypothetical protein
MTSFVILHDTALYHHSNIPALQHPDHLLLAVVEQAQGLYAGTNKPIHKDERDHPGKK